MNLLIFLLVACFWGGSFVAIQPLVQVMPPVWAGALRIAVSLVFLGLVIPRLGIPLRLSHELRARVWGTGLVAFGLPFALLFWGERSISPGLAGILNGTVPLWVFVLGLAFTPGVEPVTSRKVAGLLGGLLGVIAIFQPRLATAGQDPSLAGVVAVTLMAMSYGVSVLSNRVIFSNHPKLHPFTNLFQQQCAGFLVIALFALIVDGVPVPAQWQPWSTVVVCELYLGVMSTSIAFMMFYRVIRAWGAVRAATVTYIVPAAALGFDLILNGHAPRASDLLGIVCVTAGVVALNWPARKA
jgi:drug/metabolite transporter (DMT)-like permease